MEKTSRLNIRVTEQQHALLREAAERAGVTVSDYVLQHVLADAEDDLIDGPKFVVDAAGWRELQARLAEPRRRNPALRKLLARQPQWDQSAAADVAGLTQDGWRFVIQVKPWAKEAVRVLSGDRLTVSEDEWETFVIGSLEDRRAARA